MVTPVAYFRADSAGNIIWDQYGCDACVESIYPIDEKDLDESGNPTMSLAVYVAPPELQHLIAEIQSLRVENELLKMRLNETKSHK